MVPAGLCPPFTATLQSHPATVSSTSNASSGTRVLLVLASLVIVIAGIKAASEIVIPLLLAMFFALILTPPMLWLQRRSLPPWAALGLILLGLALFVVTVGSLIGASLDRFTSLLPAYELKLRAMVAGISDWAQAHELPILPAVDHSMIDPQAAVGILGRLLGSIGRILGDSLLITLTVLFLLVEATTIPKKLQAILPDPEQTLQRFSGFLTSVKQYLVIKAVMSLITGSAVTALLLVLGIDFAVLWGALAFFMNFVPYVGSVIAALPVVFLAFLDTGGQTALLVTGCYLVVNLVVSNVLEPRYMGSGLGLSTLVVFISLVFWGWVLGPVGMFLSAPLTMLVKIALESDPRSRWIAVLLSAGAPRKV